MFKHKLAIIGIALLLAGTQSSFSQTDSLHNPSVTIKKVDQIVIGIKTIKTDSNTQKIIDPTTVSHLAVFPGSITVMDMRDSVEFQIIPESDSVIASRIRRLENIMPMPYNEDVKKYVDYF
ncbi:MAG: hypothetical protein ACI9QN_002830, partial [Arcticibacterium sp.]